MINLIMQLEFLMMALGLSPCMMIKTPNIWEMGPYKSLTNSMANFVYKKIRELERLKNKRYSCFFIRNMGHGKNY